MGSLGLEDDENSICWRGNLKSHYLKIITLNLVKSARSIIDPAGFFRPFELVGDSPGTWLHQNVIFGFTISSLRVSNVL